MLMDMLSRGADRHRGGAVLRCPCAYPGNLQIGGIYMPDATSQDHTYTVGHITFIVTPVYQSGQGDTITEILLKMMIADVGRK